MTPRHRTPSPPSALRVLRAKLLRHVPVRSWLDLRKPRLLAGLALILALVAGGTGIAVAANQSSTPSDAAVAVDRGAGADRANRDYDRTTASPSPSVTESPSPSVAPTTAAPATTAPAPATTAPKAVPTTPKTATATPRKTTAAPVPAGCSSYSGNQLTACQLLPSFGFSTSEMSALVPMWNKESSWNSRAENPSSGAYGIPQALPGSKMASAGSDWQTNPATQIKWGLGYIRDVYGTPSDAWAFWQNNGWY